MKKQLAVVVTLATLLTVVNAYAHVKWFVKFDITQSPQPLVNVLTPIWLTCFAITVLFVFVFFIIDRYLLRTRFLLETGKRIKHLEHFVFPFYRSAIATYFFAIWLYGGIVFAPELTTDNSIVHWMQLAAAILVIPRITSVITSFIIILLYGYCIFKFGIYHMLDYLIILGVGFFVLLSYVESYAKQTTAESAHHLKLFILYITLAFSLAWGAMEKFFYEKRFMSIIEHRPHIAMAIPPHLYVIISGFVEFTLAFMLISGTFFARLVAVGILSLFLLGIYEFGYLDMIGHLLIISAFVVMIIIGPSKYRKPFVLSKLPLYTEAAFFVALYVIELFIFILTYYYLHYFIYSTS